MRFWRRQKPLYPRWIVRAKWAVFAVLSCALALNILFPPPIKRAYENSVVINDRHGEWLSAFPVENGIWRLKANLSDIDPKFIQSLLAIEDKRFFSHGGVDFPAIIRAARSWRVAGHVVSGASTLTMQLVRQIEPNPRTLKSKIFESFRALQYEVRLSKRDILELYLTHTPYGGNIEGIEAASRAYFDKPPLELTNSEIALLIALPQAPESRRPDRHPEMARKGRDRILRKMFEAGILSHIEFKEALEDSIQPAKANFSILAWHTANRLKGDVNPRTGHIRASVDRRLQAKAERLALQYTQDGGFNVSALIVENETMKVRAHIGSAGRDRPGGWLDMTAYPRSPGSTLKPFVYGFAFDDGLSAPASMVLDAPTRFGGYQPENFNRRYHGQVRIYEALGHSLNVPAVIALEKVGSQRFETALKLAGLDIRRPETPDSAQNLAIALGGLGLRVEDLAVLYAGLANDGEIRPLVWKEQKTAKGRYQMMRPQSARDITEILQQAPTPRGRVPHWLTQETSAIAYKTGTSYGFRDAWAAGYTDKYTVIVWVGRPDSAPRVGQTGRNAAAPFMFKLFDLLPGNERNTDFHKIADAPKGVIKFGGYQEGAPQIIFPPDGAEILSNGFGNEALGMSFVARSEEHKSLKWFVDGQPVRKDNNGVSIWKPSEPGFYQVSVVDTNGLTTRSNIRVLAIN